MSELLFVYGTLRRGGGHDLETMFEDARFVEAAEFCGKMVLVSYFPGVVDSKKNTAKVSGELYELGDDGESLRALDEFEDYRPDDLGAGVYVRERRKVTVKGGGSKEAWIYLYNRSLEGLREIESGDFVRFLGESSTG